MEARADNLGVGLELFDGGDAISVERDEFDAATLAPKVAAGEVTRATLVWKAGMANWAAAGSVPELQALFAHLPPPLPS